MLVVILTFPGAGPDANERRRVTAPSGEVSYCDPLCAGQLGRAAGVSPGKRRTVDRTHVLAESKATEAARSRELSSPWICARL